MQRDEILRELNANPDVLMGEFDMVREFLIYNKWESIVVNMTSEEPLDPELWLAAIQMDSPICSIEEKLAAAKRLGWGLSVGPVRREVQSAVIRYCNHGEFNIPFKSMSVGTLEDLVNEYDNKDYQFAVLEAFKHATLKAHRHA